MNTNESVESVNVRCECSHYETSEDSTGCTASTRNTFAPGHDAKLKSFLIRNHGVEIWDTRGVASDSHTVARRFGFEAQVVAGIAKATAKAEARSAKKTARSATAENDAFEQAMREVQAERNAAIEEAETKAKVGRWEYTGFVNNGQFTYRDAKGNFKATRTYTLV